jgi:hypothetical protein
MLPDHEQVPPNLSTGRCFPHKYGADLIVTLTFQFPDAEFLLGSAHTLEFEI